MSATIAYASLRHRGFALIATFVSVLLGAALMGTFATLFETSFAAVSAEDAETLRIMGGVVGGWSTAIVLFSVASTLSIVVVQRANEIALLRMLGATPRRVRRLIRVETLGVAAPAAGLGILIASQTGPAVLHLLRNADVVAAQTPNAGSNAALGATFVIVVAVSVLAASITARRASRGAPTLALNEARAGTGRMRWWRLVIGGVLIAYGVAMAVVTITVTRHADDPYAAMSTSGSSAVLVGVGLATLAPLLLRMGAALIVPVARRWRIPGWLAVQNTSRRPHLLGSVLAPVIVLTATSMGVLMLVGIDHRTIGEGHPEARTINLLNNLITGMVSLFAAIMVINALAAVVAGRRQEFALLRLLGATPRQAHYAVVAESAIVAAVGVVVGSAASLATIVPFAVARGEGVVPDGQLWLPPLLLIGVATLTVVAAFGAVRRIGLTATPSR